MSWTDMNGTGSRKKANRPPPVVYVTGETGCREGHMTSKRDTFLFVRYDNSDGYIYRTSTERNNPSQQYLVEKWPK